MSRGRKIMDSFIGSHRSPTKFRHMTDFTIPARADGSRWTYTPPRIFVAQPPRAQPGVTGRSRAQSPAELLLEPDVVREPDSAFAPLCSVCGFECITEPDARGRCLACAIQDRGSVSQDVPIAVPDDTSDRSLRICCHCHCLVSPIVGCGCDW